MQKVGNPTWGRDELILALDLYLSKRDCPPGKTSSEIAALSALLNRMAAKFGFLGSPTYRNANGVYMKLMNFRALDPAYTHDGKVGLARVGKRDKEVWAEFGSNPEGCALAAKMVREVLANDPIPEG